MSLTPLLALKAHFRQNLHHYLGYTFTFRNRYHSQLYKHEYRLQMAKKKSSTPAEGYLLLPTPPSSLPIVDTHTHVAATFEYYRGRYKEGRYLDVYEFVKAMYVDRNVEAVVDVWCEVPARKILQILRWDKEKRGELKYWFVMGTWCKLFSKLHNDLRWCL